MIAEPVATTHRLRSGLVLKQRLNAEETLIHVRIRITP